MGDITSRPHDKYISINNGAGVNLIRSRSNRVYNLPTYIVSPQVLVRLASHVTHIHARKGVCVSDRVLPSYRIPGREEIHLRSFIRGEFVDFPLAS